MREAITIRNRTGFEQKNINFKPPNKQKRIRKIKQAQNRLVKEKRMAGEKVAQLAGPELALFLEGADPTNQSHVRHVSELLNRLNIHRIYHPAISDAHSFLRKVPQQPRNS